MTDETTGATGTQADPGTQPPAGTSPTQADEESGEQSQPATISLEEARKLRSEANGLRKRLKDLEAAKAKTDEAELSEQQRLEKKVADLERQIADQTRDSQDKAVRYATVTSAAKLGFADPEDAYRLLDHTALEFDEDGSPRNVADQLAALAKTKPYLLSTRSVGSPDTGLGGGRSATPKTYTREQLRDPKFFAANRDDILKAQTEGRISG